MESSGKITLVASSRKIEEADKCERQPEWHEQDSYAVEAAFASFPPELRCVARSPLTQCFTIHGCCWTSSSVIRFSGSRTRSYHRSGLTTQRISWSAYSEDQVLSFRAYETWDRHFSSGYPPLCHYWSIFERSFANKKLVCQDAQAP